MKLTGKAKAKQAQANTSNTYNETLMKADLADMLIKMKQQEAMGIDVNDPAIRAEHEAVIAKVFDAIHGAGASTKLVPVIKLKSEVGKDVPTVPITDPKLMEWANIVMKENM